MVMTLITINIHIENARATPPHLDAFLRSGCYGEMQSSFNFFVLFASGFLGWLLLGWILAPAGTVFAPPGWILCPPGPHFESFVSLWGEPEVPGARHCEKFEKVRKMKRLGSSIGSLLGHILRPLPPKIEPTGVLLRSFVSVFSRAFLAVFRSGFSRRSC